MQFLWLWTDFVTLKAKKEQQKSQIGHNYYKGSPIIGPLILLADKGVQNKYLKISESGKKHDLKITFWNFLANLIVMPKNDFLKLPRISK